MAYQRGDVVYVPFQYTDLSSGKVRPALVVSSAELHAADRLYIVAAITSNVAASPLGHLIGDLTSAGLKVPSLVRPVLLTLDPSVMGRRVGCMAAADLHEVNVMLQRTLGLPLSRK
jgi:mRNA interferase MazF